MRYWPWDSNRWGKIKNGSQVASWIDRGHTLFLVWFLSSRAHAHRPPSEFTLLLLINISLGCWAQLTISPQRLGVANNILFILLKSTYEFTLQHPIKRSPSNTTACCVLVGHRQTGHTVHISYALWSKRCLHTSLVERTPSVEYPSWFYRRQVGR